MFIRVKTIAGKRYAYAVENTWKKGKTIQKVKKYLGPVVATERHKSVPFAEWKERALENYIDNTSARNILKEIVRHAVAMHGFHGKPPSKDHVVVDLSKGTVLKGRKEVVLELGEGFLCRETIKGLLNFKPVEEQRRGEHLAEALLRAGIKTEKELFILLYRKIYNI